MKANNYKRPEIRTMAASRIVEQLGPVSCGSARSGDFGAGTNSMVPGTGDKLITSR